MKTLASALLIAAAVFVSGCSAPEMIDRTQPNYIKKEDLLTGTWYFKESVVDVAKTSPAATIGYGGSIDKIRWEIHEDLLVGYRSYEFIPGIDPRVDREKSTIGHVVFKDTDNYQMTCMNCHIILCLAAMGGALLS